MSTIEFIVLAAGLMAVLALQFAVFTRSKRTDGSAHAFERLERELRHELQTSAQATRQEMAAHLAQNQAATAQQLDAMRQQIQLHAAGGREEQARVLKPSPR
jgi:DNA recombination protein RmuC